MVEEKLEVIPAGEFFPRRTYGVVLRKGKILTPQAKRFVNLLLSNGEIANGAVKDPELTVGKMLTRT